MVRLIERKETGADLLARYREGGAPELFGQIMRAYGGMVFSVCLKVTRDAADAEDASQATFLTLAVQCKTGAKINYLGPWLKKVARRSSLDLVRSRKRRSRREAITASQRLEFDGTSPSEPSEASELSQIIRHELEQLPGKYRMPLVLHYFGGLSHDEISREMHCTTSALGVRLHRARKMLGKRLSARGITLEGAALIAAVATAVNYALSERFIHSTQQAAMAVAWSHPSTAYASLHASLPGHLSMVPQLVSEVAQSMARARTRVAALALAASVTMLGGAAEAVRHLPDSIRPNLDFLSPAKAIEDLFRSPVRVPSLRSQLPTPNPTFAKVDEPAGEDTSNTITYAAPVPMLAAATPNQPVLMLKIPPPPPPPHVDPPRPAPPQTQPPRQLVLVHPTVQADPPLVTPKPSSESRGTTQLNAPSTGGSHNNHEAVSVERPTQVASASGTHRPQGSPITTFIPSPDSMTRISRNLVLTEGLMDSFIGTSTSVDPFVGPYTGGTGMVTGAYSSYLSLASVEPNQIQVSAGAGDYHWADAPSGILAGGVNSVDLTVTGAAADGVITVERLSVNTLFAPERPTGHHFIGIWSFDSTVPFDKIALGIHYDNEFAESLGLDEKILKLWVYDNSRWIRVRDESFWRDLDTHSLGGTWSNLSYFAVSAPEPSAIFGLALVGGFGLLRRRRRSR